MWAPFNSSCPWVSWCRYYKGERDRDRNMDKNNETKDGTRKIREREIEIEKWMKITRPKMGQEKWFLFWQNRTTKNKKTTKKNTSRSLGD